MKRQIIGSLEEELKKQNEHQLKTLEREYKEEISQLEFWQQQEVLDMKEWLTERYEKELLSLQTEKDSLDLKLHHDPEINDLEFDIKTLKSEITSLK